MFMSIEQTQEVKDEDNQEARSTSSSCVTQKLTILHMLQIGQEKRLEDEEARKKNILLWAVDKLKNVTNMSCNRNQLR